MLVPKQRPLFEEKVKFIFTVHFIILPFAEKFGPLHSVRFFGMRANRLPAKAFSAPGVQAAILNLAFLTSFFSSLPSF